MLDRPVEGRHIPMLGPRPCRCPSRSRSASHAFSCTAANARWLSPDAASALPIPASPYRRPGPSWTAWAPLAPRTSPRASPRPSAAQPSPTPLAAPPPPPACPPPPAPAPPPPRRPAAPPANPTPCCGPASPWPPAPPRPRPAPPPAPPPTPPGTDTLEPEMPAQSSKGIGKGWNWLSILGGQAWRESEALSILVHIQRDHAVGLDQQRGGPEYDAIGPLALGRCRRRPAPARRRCARRCRTAPIAWRAASCRRPGHPRAASASFAARTAGAPTCRGAPCAPKLRAASALVPGPLSSRKPARMTSLALP